VLWPLCYTVKFKVYILKFYEDSINLYEGFWKIIFKKCTSVVSYGSQLVCLLVCLFELLFSKCFQRMKSLNNGGKIQDFLCSLLEYRFSLVDYTKPPGMIFSQTGIRWQISPSKALIGTGQFYSLPNNPRDVIIHLSVVCHLSIR